MSIDFRVRPPIPSYRNAEFYNDIEDVSQRAARFGAEISPCAHTFSMEDLIREMDASGVEQAVVPIRKGCGGDNEDLLHLFSEWPSRFIGLAGLAPLAGMEEALRELDHQGHSWKLSQYASNALCEDVKKIIRLSGSEGKA